MAFTYGRGVYAIKLPTRPSASACLAAIVDHLAEMAEQGPGGVTWFTPPELLGRWARSVSPRQAGQGVAGFSSWDLKAGKPAWFADTGFLTGAAGIGLALLAAASPCEPLWDRVLLADVPG